MPQIDEKRLQELADKTIYARTNQLNDYVLDTIGGRIKATGRASAYDQQVLKNMADITGDMAKINKKLAVTMEMNVKDVEEILTQTVTEGVNSYKPLYDFKGMEFVPFENNEYAQFLVSHWAEETAENMINLSRTKALSFDRYNVAGDLIGTTPLEGAFQKAIDDAVIAVSSGTTDFNAAMRKTVESLGGSGVRVNYGNNVTRSLPSMVRQNLLYGAKQACQAYDRYVGEQLGCDGFEVDYHAHPRPSHEFMGGKMYAYEGTVRIGGKTYENGSEALARLGDYGCLHFKTDVILGVSEPRYDEKWLAEQKKNDTELIEYNGVKKTKYEWQQGARRLEAETRKQGDISYMAKASGDKTLERKTNEKIAVYRKGYDDLCDKVGLEKRYNRMATFNAKKADSKPVYQYGKSQEIKKAIETPVFPEIGGRVKVGNVETEVRSIVRKGNNSTVVTKNGNFNADKVIPTSRPQHTEPYSFTKITSADNNLQITYSETVSNQSKNAITSYSKHYDEVVNKYLRTGNLNTTLPNGEITTDKKVNSIITNLSKAINDSPPLNHNAKLYRGVDDLSFLGNDITKDNIVDMVKNNNIKHHELGFMSTSSELEQAEKFGDIIFEIDTTADQRKLLLSSYSKYYSESEYLFDKGSTLELYDAYKKDKKLIIKARIQTNPTHVKL